MTSVQWVSDPQITLVPGFRASGVACGLKANGALDLALVVADVPCVAAAVFTTNRIQAAPVLYDRAIIRSGNRIRAVAINSGCANACTGDRGLQDAREMAEIASLAVGGEPGAALVMSTGVIGQHLAISKVAAGIAHASATLARDGGHAAARAIMTTDTRPKEAAVQVNVDGTAVTIAGMCKGAGMIHPNMATMLAVLATDAAIEQALLQQALVQVVDQTFNAITVDGDTSTNDTVAILASGTAGHAVISDPALPAYAAFVDGLLEVSRTLARALVRDGEGATKFVTIQVSGARSVPEARQVAKTIATSTLVKTAIYGQDANWGRILCAAGYSGVEFDPARLSLWMIGDADMLCLVRDGAPFEIDEPRAAAILAADEVTFRVDLGQGKSQGTVWTCDLTHAYVDINAHYRT